ncbi:DUF1656 domain-containing protein [Xylophilus sp. GOD-11R]|uniref:DUF1656 domain-containing protein n=1 Tax=Xylophilus sp. GOD-11R TaxID=3089814 RepID=UPI00298D0212|nr:DUF1656 domain-containing protein [Xylophilus sp. GOD-11R]WPB56397.1 DUF1656 domain-containing protein [Xylophilus sp. GOD-11R]
MIGEASFYGLYLPWLMLLAGGALLASWVLRRLLATAGVYRWVWHPALFDIALYVLVLYLLVRLTEVPFQ